jgi:radical SAM superfamily enzyme YgiQ (UPF0313 family)
MRYFEPVFRPPSEADSLILQVTVGCSHNACTFCAMYRNKSYAVRPLEEILGEISEASGRWPGTSRVFLGDGDALAAPAEFLAEVLESLGRSFPRLHRVSLYATPTNLLQKSVQELRDLAARGLKLFYLGLESGSDAVLRRVGKGVTSAEAVESVLKGQDAGMRSSVMVLLGLGGEEGAEEHARSTADAANRIQPDYLSALTWYPVQEAPLHRQMEAGRFSLPGDEGILQELEWLLQGLELKDTVFHSNHASNPLPLRGRLSRDKEKLLGEVVAARRGQVPLRPFFFRGT